MLRPIDVDLSYDHGCTGQVITILEKLDELLLASASSKQHLLKAQVFLRDVTAGYQAFAEQWNAWIEGAYLPVCFTHQWKK
jgi:enamine deaminase RidA (YjgF/YER057c/UK114 family)